ncbi:glycosyltransferase family 4 protein [Mycolicibacterium austroafricanum]|uniref:glycosyltransferase family 4 protein n=1 Tax=Mycolicibacterium austroafricanum TaxID=39687 RepID=UPI001F370E03|nr:glycosyltransferase family 4 protein [Mycolicibacterium austroafricanum]
MGINYAPEVTGIAPYTTGFVEGMVRAGHDVFVLTAPPHYPEWRISPGYEHVRQAEEINGALVRRVRLGAPVRPGARGRLMLEAGFAQGVVRARWRRPDLVVTVSPTLLSAAAVIARARLTGVPCGVVVQDLYGKGVVETGAMSGPLAKAAARFEGTALNGANGVAVIHERFVDNVVALGVDRSKVEVIRNWTHIAPEVEVAPAADIRASLGWQPNEIVAVHTGNMGVKQGLDNVIEAAKLASAAGGPRVRFVLVGDGNQRARLQERARNVAQVEFVDPLPESEFRRVLSAADVLLVNEKPGVGEMAVPSKLTSYFVSGRPVVAATDPSSGAAHEINASGAGHLVAAGDPAALLSAVITVGSDSEAAARLAANGRTYALSTLSAAKAVDHYDEWCQSLVAR